MGTWSATIFGNDTSCDIKDEFFERYNRGEEPIDIKDDLLPYEDDDDRFDVIFSLAHCLWEVGQLEDEFLLRIKEVIENGEDLVVAKELGADDKFLRQRQNYLIKFLDKISVKKARPKKRVAPPVPIDSKYRNGAVMAFQYHDGMWGALIAINGRFFDKQTFYCYIQTTIKTTQKPTMYDVCKSYIIDANFHNRERNSLPWRSPQFYYAFDSCFRQYLGVRETKKFEPYNDSLFEIIGYLSDWGECSGAIHSHFEYGSKTVEEFQFEARKRLGAEYNKHISVHTTMTVEEIDEEFRMRLNS
ncbi:hypothetical protein HMPREF0389_01019 [Filifactor alocis ATCC 35896]|uniref:DUF4259 domain-containing protein n=1 Tax=Filifactor alocis (strain ATCC 35896 / CCUG 47790 / D40 B5) TaxID=546269 RepID=D6GQP4_FILAD|nr:hypothetical protein [Filifactor alocis]EFE29097.1 hypothetical protein HMPREF0389_01019 [Filifactor alocis ATCC 35896]